MQKSWPNNIEHQGCIIHQLHIPYLIISHYITIKSHCKIFVVGSIHLQKFVAHIFFLVIYHQSTSFLLLSIPSLIHQSHISNDISIHHHFATIITSGYIHHSFTGYISPLFLQFPIYPFFRPIPCSMAGLWATKLAVACGSSESISKLFSTQRRRIYALEQRTAEAQMNNEAGGSPVGGQGMGMVGGFRRKNGKKVGLGDLSNRMDGFSIVEQKTWWFQVRLKDENLEQTNGWRLASRGREVHVPFGFHDHLDVKDDIPG